MCCFVFFKQKTAYEMRISDWSSDVCSSDLEDCEIWPRANGRRQIAASGRHSRRRTDVQRNGANPIHLYCVEILLNGQATRLQFLLDRASEAAPAIAGDTGNRDRPAGPVVLAVEVAVAFQLDEVRTDIIPPPTVQPIFRPFVIVAREAALRMHSIYRRPARTWEE